MKRLLFYLRPYRKEAILGPIFKLIEAVFELLIPVLVARIIDIGIKNEDTAYILRCGALMLLLGVLGLAAALVCQFFAASASEGFGKTLREELYKKINRFSAPELERFGVSSLSHRIIGDTERVQHGVAMAIRLASRAPFLTVGALVAACLVAPRLAWIFALASLCIALFLYFLLRQQAKLYRRLQIFLDSLARKAGETLAGLRVIRAFRREKERKCDFDAENDAFSKDYLRAEAISVLLHPVTSIFVNFAVCAILWFGGSFVSTGSLQPGEIVALISYLTQILLAMMALANLLVIFTRAGASAERVSEVLFTEPKIQDPSDPEEADCQSSEAVRFEDVSFAYPHAKRMALSNIRFVANRGETLGIIGGTGAGKSTLGALLCRFYEATEGTVFVFGTDVRKQKISSLRAFIGLVSQRFFLFSGTLRENLSFANPEASDEELFAALQTAQAESFVRELPQGLDTVVNRGGRNFSGGQRQRIAIARALLSHAPILVFDDSASALDYATDASLRRALREVARDKTVFLISQRVSTVQGADRILVLDHGNLVGNGTHDVLLESCPIYAEICASQREESSEQEGV